MLRHQPQNSAQDHILLQATKLVSTIAKIIPIGGQLVVAVEDKNGLGYPIVQFAEERESLPPDPQLSEKYLKLRRTLLHFRSHSRGTMAKYKYKVENERLAGNDVGRAILKKLCADQILILEGNFYFLQPENVDRHLGVSWIDLQRGRTSQRLVNYLRSIA